MKYRVYSYLLCISAVLKVLIVACKHPGVTVSISQEGLEKIQYQYIQSFTENLKPLLINKELKTKVTLPFIGEAVLNITNPQIQIHEMKPDQIDYTFIAADKAINLKLKNFSADLSFDLYLLTGFVELGTYATLTLNDLSISTEFTIPSVISNRKDDQILLPSIQLNKFIFLNDFWFDIKFTTFGPIESLLSFLAGSVTGTIKDVVNDLYNQLIIDNLNPILTQLFELAPNMFKIPKPGFYIDYSLLNDLKFHGNSLEISVLIDLLDKNKHRFSITEGSTLPSNIETNGVLIYINQNIIDDVIGGVFENGYMKISVGYDNFYNKQTNSSILNTTTFDIIEGMSIYPLETPMYVDCMAYKSIPVLKLDNVSSKLFFGAKCAYIVRIDHHTNSTAFTVYMGVESNFDLKVKEGTLYGMISNINLIEVEQIKSESTIDVDVSIIKFLFSFTSIIENIVNKYLHDTGVKIPVIDGLSFSESTLEILSGFIKFELIPVFDSHVTLIK